MAEARATLRLAVDGMTCGNCEQRIEAAVRGLPGVHSVRASASLSEVRVRFDPGVTGIEAIRQAITTAGYAVRSDASAPGPTPSRGGTALRVLGLLAVVAALAILAGAAGRGRFLPAISQNMGYGLIFVVGLITSLHCIAMCGGIAVSQGMHAAGAPLGAGGSCPEPGTPRARAQVVPSLLYNAGRVVSYTAIGAVVGGVGSLFSLSTTLKGLMPVIAGAFMLVLGVRMLGIFPWLSRLRIRLPFRAGKRLSAAASRGGPFVVGLLNGLMPCGPLQTMQVYALGTGSVLAGAFSMFLFSLGTVPLMLGFGAISSLLSAKFNRWMLRASGALVMALGLVMFARGMNLFGVAMPALAAARAEQQPVQAAAAGPARGAGQGAAVARVSGRVQEVTTTVESGRYQPLVVQKGIPVRWTITVAAQDLNGCNNPVTVPRYGIRKTLVPGDNLIEFTPKEEGTIVYTCWMGMISSEIRVVSDVSQAGTGAASGPAAGRGAGAGSCCTAGAPGGTQSVEVRVDGLSRLEVAAVRRQVDSFRASSTGISPCCGY